ncbi:MAG: AAA family ATPase [Proteobacteria bacterium]|nr:AAA family ATPase [Pseudomonadota bacterium]
MLSGEIGCGKTTLTRVFVQELSAEPFEIGLLANPKLGPLEFLQEVAYQLGISDIPSTKAQWLRLLSDKLVENVKAHKETILIIDEAQLVSDLVFDEIRLLLNFQSNDRFLINVFLVGQPELKGRVKGIEQLDQRIAIRYHIEPFNLEDTDHYIAFRQKKAGRNENAFHPEAVERIYEMTKGVPRKINNLCDLSLLIGFSKNERVVTPEIVEAIVRDGALI